MGFVIKHKVGGSFAWPAASVELPRKASWLLVLCWLAVLQTAGCASQPPLKDVASRPPNVIRDFWTIETPEAVAVIVKSDQPLTYTAIRQEDPRGVYFQFPATALEGLDAVYFPPPNPVIRSIRSAEAAVESEARVFLELAQDTTYEVVPDREGLKIVFRKPSGVAAFGGMPDISGIEGPPLKMPPATSKIEPGPPKMAAVAPAPVASVLRDVRTEVRADAVLIRLTADGRVITANVFTLEDPARIVFDFMGLHSAFKGEQRIPVRSEWVRQVRHLAYPDKVRLVADTEARYLKSYSMEPTADGLVITVGQMAAGDKKK
jgi:type IV pilus assembly protein PilQ